MSSGRLRAVESHLGKLVLRRDMAFSSRLSFRMSSSSDSGCRLGVGGDDERDRKSESQRRQKGGCCGGIVQTRTHHRFTVSCAASYSAHATSRAPAALLTSRQASLSLRWADSIAA